MVCVNMKMLLLSADARGPYGELPAGELHCELRMLFDACLFVRSTDVTLPGHPGPPQYGGRHERGNPHGPITVGRRVPEIGGVRVPSS
jgi:hypothetical protein